MIADTVTAARVVDGTVYRLAEAVRTALAHGDVAATIADPVAMTAPGLSVLLLPADPAFGGRALVRSLFVVNRTATEGGTQPPRLVVVWCVPASHRARFAAPRSGPGPGEWGWNASALVCGTAWSAELAAHRGDTGAAVACRHGRVLRVVRSWSHATLGGRDVTAVLADIATVDPDAVHALVTEVPDELGPPRWTALDSVAAAVAHRRHR